MFPRHGEIPPTFLLIVKRCVSSIALVLLVAAAVSQVNARVIQFSVDGSNR